MADPICRWNNPYVKNVRKLISWLPKQEMSQDQAKTEIVKVCKNFFKTPYQMACQLGLYLEHDNIFYPRFRHIPNTEELFVYMRNWIYNYYVPNPYIRDSSFNTIKPFYLHSKLCDELQKRQKSLKWDTISNKIFGGSIGNDDIIKNTINTYSEVIQIDGNILKLKSAIDYSDLAFYVKDISITARDDKVTFFNNFGVISKKHDMENTIYFGAPGTGKSHKVDKIVEPLDDRFKEKVTFHPEYDHASFVGCYKPVSEGDDIKYKFSPQVFTNIYVKSWNDSLNSYYLVIDEINRGNCAEIFGDLFQLLDRKDTGESKYEITPSEDLKKYLIEQFGGENMGIANGKMRLPSNLVILATMNTSDQSLYPMDSAFKRRWDWIYVPIEYGEKCSDGRDNDSFNFKVEIENTDGEDIRIFSWIEFIKAINETKIKNNSNLGADKQIGNYFVKPKKGNDGNFENIKFKDFIHKVMFYLWNDVFKDERKEDSIFGDKIYQDLFPIETNGLIMIENILRELKVDFTEKLAVVSSKDAD